ncbi:MAG: response regulator transcription factor [Bacteroidetes bacterium]|nr:MAG: response regulator transcription factor [Bacteroidota bacterium]
MPKRIPSHNTEKLDARNPGTRVLVVQDEPHLLDSIARRLAAHGYAVDTAHDGEEGYQLAMTRKYPVVVLDILLPKKDGLSVIRDLRRHKIDCLLIVLTAKNLVEDRVDSLQAGADDFLMKPFAFIELLARIEALLRRYHFDISPVIHLADIELDTITRIVRRANKTIRLTEKQFLLLEYLIRNKNRTITRSEISKHVWGYDFVPESNVIDAYIKHLRQVLDKGFPKRLIYTVRGEGFLMKEE